MPVTKGRMWRKIEPGTVQAYDYQYVERLRRVAKAAYYFYQIHATSQPTDEQTELVDALGELYDLGAEE